MADILYSLLVTLTFVNLVVADGHADFRHQSFDMLFKHKMEGKNQTDNTTEVISENATLEVFREVEELGMCGDEDCECLKPDLISKLLGVEATVISEENLGHISVIFLYYIHNPSAACRLFRANGTTYDLILGLTASRFDRLLLDVVVKLEESGHEDENNDDNEDEDLENEEDDHDHGRCVDLAHLKETAGTMEDEIMGTVIGSVEVIVIVLTGKEVRRSCELSDLIPPQMFLSDIITQFDGEEGITIEDFKEILSSLSIGGKESHSDEEEGHDSHEDESHDRRKKRHVAGGAGNVRITRDTHGMNSGNVSQCFSPTELLSIYGIEEDDDVILTSDDITNFCPSLLQQQISGLCKETEAEEADKTVSNAEKYGWGSLAVFLICITAVFGLIFISCLSGSGYKYIMSFLIAIAVGTLTGDATLHLIPVALGIHVHGEGSDHHHEGEGLVIEDFVFKGLVFLGSFFLFFMLESGMDAISGGHSHSEHQEHEGSQGDLPNQTNFTDIAQANGKDMSKVENGGPVASPEKTKGFFELKPVAWMILIGDAVHNFADGLAIGAAFSLDVLGGLSTSIAIFCHEVPHEFGDFAVLINSGMSYKKAAIFNMISALTAFLGLYVGIAVSVNDDVITWIFSVAAGMFIYIALADMVPELVTLQRSKNRFVLFLLQALGYLTGVAILFVIAIYEEQIQV